MTWPLTLLATALLVVTVVFLGCSGGHGPTLPSPDTGGDQTVETEDYVVEAGETVRYDSDTVIDCDSARIDGQVIGADGSAPGEPGVSITIQAEGDVVISGNVRAGDGGRAADAPHAMSTPGDGTTGGDGGSLRIASATGDMTLTDGAQVIAGDGAPGGDSLTGGPGGQGGDVTLHAPQGTLSLATSTDLIHQGNGGDGGTGRIEGDDIGGFSGMDAGTAHGGDGGSLSMVSAALSGVEMAGEGSDSVIWLNPDAGRITGGNGGGGGSVGRAGEPAVPTDLDTAQSLAPTGRDKGPMRPLNNGENVIWLVGGDGGDGFTSGEGGRPGDGGVVNHGHRTSPPDDHVGARGGKGGDQDFSTYTTEDGRVVPICPKRRMRGGKGGGAYAFGRRGRDGDPCGQATDGGSATGIGGDGGRVKEEKVPAFVWWEDEFRGSRGGRGGHGNAVAGSGGDAGDCCDPPGPGHPGGFAGPTATARGGNGADQRRITGGSAGSAFAKGGRGGHGADGQPPGLGGTASSTVEATAGEPGEGDPPGWEAKAETTRQEDGLRGEPCAGPAPDPGFYAVVRQLVSALNAYYRIDPRVRISDLVEPQPSAAGPAQVQLPGPQGSFGQGMDVPLDGSRIYLAHEGVSVWLNAQSGVADDPNFILTPSGANANVPRAISCWLDEARDILFAIFEVAQFERDDARICGWRNASQLSANRAPEISYTVAGNDVRGTIVGGADHDVLFIETFDGVHAIDNPADRAGTIAPDRTVSFTDGTHAMAYDDIRDILYAFNRDFGPLQRHTIMALPGASEATGDQEGLREFRGTSYRDIGGFHDNVYALDLLADDDVLFVGSQEDQIVMFTQASTLTGEVEPAIRHTPEDLLQNFAIWRAR